MELITEFEEIASEFGKKQAELLKSQNSEAELRAAKTLSETKFTELKVENQNLQDLLAKLIHGASERHDFAKKAQELEKVLSDREKKATEAKIAMEMQIARIQESHRALQRRSLEVGMRCANLEEERAEEASKREALKNEFLEYREQQERRYAEKCEELARANQVSEKMRAKYERQISELMSSPIALAATTSSRTVAALKEKLTQLRAEYEAKIASLSRSRK
ncbi:hypothetical protein PAPYR_13498 [Paratrimastix pyriformis]|uniref:Uncharacterized protein n=1 Tax=Paratrimastix pyriformis TaxID=342808 RepID=A0ABQ8U060_9EUKA|nr:hypothetical protein PAPYR_13498 [Paratrimastix pyriformis]